MAYRPAKSGLAADADRKLQSKYDPQLANDLCRWVEKIIGEDIDCDGDKKKFHDTFKDGVLLCKIANAIYPGSVKRINKGNTPFIYMGNIDAFLQTIKNKLRVPDHETFQTTELVEGTNLFAVTCCLSSVARKCNEIDGLEGFGPKEAKENKREFTAEQMRAGEAVIGLQAGSNKGATQAGQNFGQTRHM